MTSSSLTTRLSWLLVIGLSSFAWHSRLAIAQQDSTNTIKVEQLVRRAPGARIALRSYATIVISPNTLAKDTMIVAELDLDSNTLTINTKDEQRLSGRVSVEVNFDRFPNGLTVLLQTSRSAARGFTGTLTSVDAKSFTLSVETPDEVREIALPRNVNTLRQQDDQPPRGVSLDELGLGDQVTITMRDDGKTPKLILAKFKMASGIVRSVAARRIALDNGVAYSVSQNVLVTSATNEELEMADLRIGQRVKMRLNPMTNEAWEITLGRIRGSDPTTASTGDTTRPTNVLAAPQILSPKDGEVAGNTTIIKGRTVPNAKVTIKTEYVRKGLLNTKGSNPDVELKADAKGDFATQPIALRGPRLLEDEVVYTITIVATRADGKVSEEAVVRVVRK